MIVWVRSSSVEGCFFPRTHQAAVFSIVEDISKRNAYLTWMFKLPNVEAQIVVLKAYIERLDPVRIISD